MRALGLLAWFAALALPLSAHAEEGTGDARAAVAVVTGAAIAVGSLAVGGLQLATHDDFGGRRSGAYTLAYGLALSPLLSHALVGEWERMLIFSAVPVVAAGTITWLVESSPGVLIEGNLNKRRALTACYSLSLLATAIGLYDSMHAGERRRARRVQFAPVVARGHVGVVVGGWL